MVCIFVLECRTRQFFYVFMFLTPEQVLGQIQNSCWILMNVCTPIDFSIRLCDTNRHNHVFYSFWNCIPLLKKLELLRFMQSSFGNLLISLKIVLETIRLDDRWMLHEHEYDAVST